MANLLKSEAKTVPLVEASPFRRLLGDLIGRLEIEVGRYGESLPPVIDRRLESRHLRYFAWLNAAILNDLEALRTLHAADAAAGNPPPDSVRFLNATIEAAERDLTALSIVSDWLTQPRSS